MGLVSTESRPARMPPREGDVSLATTCGCCTGGLTCKADEEVAGGRRDGGVTTTPTPLDDSRRRDGRSGETKERGRLRALSTDDVKKDGLSIIMAFE